MHQKHPEAGPLQDDGVRPVDASTPRHVALIMDGNGRWARRRHLPRTEGHRQGLAAARNAVRFLAQRGVRVITLFAFSSENWKRPQAEVGALMSLFVRAIAREVPRLASEGVRLRFLGERSGLPERLRDGMAQAEHDTRANQRLDLCVAVAYGGRWDVVMAARRCLEDGLAAENLDEAALAARLSTQELADVDLLIRTGGDQRISNFLLWQSAYAELVFLDTLWPEVDDSILEAALQQFASRERRFGAVSDHGDAS